MREIEWRPERVEHIMTRSLRYNSERAINIRPEWANEAVTDPDAIVKEPDPKSWAGYTRVIGYSVDAGRVLTVIVNPVDHSGVTAFPSPPAECREYFNQEDPDEQAD